MIELAAATREFLDAPGRFATIATIDADGSPLQAVVWYQLLDDGSILFNSLMGRRWPENLLRDPRMSLTVEHGYDYVSMRGEAERLHEGEAALSDILGLAARYETGDELERRATGFRKQARISFVFRPRSVLVHH
jgi:PPOX class probable F420-dependent enzyme